MRGQFFIAYLKQDFDDLNGGSESRLLTQRS
jgi:hypothetical protein